MWARTQKSLGTSSRLVALNMANCFLQPLFEFFFPTRQQVHTLECSESCYGILGPGLFILQTEEKQINTTVGLIPQCQEASLHTYSRAGQHHHTTS